MRYEDAFPAMSILPIERVLIGDRIWGWENGGNYVRKGWYVEPEPIRVDGRGLVETEDRLSINSVHFLKSKRPPRYVLIEKPAQPEPWD